MRRRLASILYASWTLSLLDSVAWAAKKARIPDEDKGYVQWGIAIGAVALICLPAFINPKRSHLG